MTYVVIVRELWRVARMIDYADWLELELEQGCGTQ